MASGEIRFDIFARDHASQTFDRVGRSSDGLGATMGRFGAFLGRAAAAGATALGALGVAGGVMGVKVAAGNEQAQIAFETMLGSAQKARDFLGKLQQFAAATPFDFPGLQTAASSLISAGINADKVIPIMTTLGDVTSGMGTGAEGVQRATIALQQMNAAGRITGEDLNQLRDAGIPVYDLLSKATGKSKAEVVKLAQAGKLGSKELGQMMKALETGKGLERFSGLMDKQSKSLTGMWSTFKDTLGQGLAKAIEPLIPMLKDGLGKASEKLAEVLPKVTDALGRFITGVQQGTGAGGQFRDAVSGTAKVLKSVGTFLVENRNVIIPLTAAVAASVAAYRGFLIVQSVTKALRIGLIMFKAWRAGTLAQTAAQMGLNGALIANPIGLVVVAIAGLVAGLVVAYKRSETFRNIVNGAFHAVAEAGKWLWDKVLRPYFHFITNAWLTVAGVIVHGAAHAFGWIPGIGPKLKAAAGKFDDFKNMVNNALDGVPNKKEVRVSAPGASKVVQQLADLRWQTEHIPRAVTVGVFNKLHGQRAGGGPVRAGLSYLVGERGPEVVTPTRDGFVHPSGTRFGGGINITVNGALDADATARKIKAMLLELKRSNGGRDLGIA